MLPEKESTVSFKDTLNLPQTDFPIRPVAKVDDPALRERWQQEKLYDKATKRNEGNDKYILHDGPPYANGHIHLGHAYNKILKDIVTKSRRMLGFHVPVKPGWDCHGLPIERKVSEEHPGADAITLKKACRMYAQQWVDIQREEFKRLGVIMDWQHPYMTMSPAYEAKTVEALGMLVDRKFIERKNKTVPWCPTDQTVLAAAEIEYKDRKDPSLYVLFELNSNDVQRIAPTNTEPMYLVVWTTTPWTLPLNRAVMMHPEAVYAVLSINGKQVIAGAELADKLTALLKVEKNVITQFKAQELEDGRARHPFIENLEVPIIFDTSVVLNEGTACVHTAPGCGPLDYEIGVKNGLEIYSPISPDGKYTHGIEPKELEGMAVIDGQIWVIKKLAERGTLFYKTSITHSYPHCWRCHNGLIFRATLQWFFNLEKENIKEKTLKAVEEITFIPAQGRNFLRATVENRWEWALSRQRVWGVPIPALLCNGCDYAYITPEFIYKVAEHINQEGIEYWDRVLVEDIQPKDLACPSCHGTSFRKETDILDVWFESGISHFAVLYDNKELNYPADIYLEGIDQHRAWFQSSLITSLAVEQDKAMKSIMSHGFTVDAKGQKMSKSLGNVVAPQQIIDQLGTDGLRLWVASIGHDGDAVVSDVLLRNVGEVYRKIRNTARGLLMNLYDYDHERDAVDVNTLLPIDHYALHRLYRLNAQTIDNYLRGNFTAVFHELADYCSTELSSFYLDIVKDRLYCDQANGHARRSAQTALWYILDTLTRLTAPIMSFTAEHLSDHYQKNKKDSIHLQRFADLANIHAMIVGEEIALDFEKLPAAYVGHVAETLRVLDQASHIVAYQEQWNLLKELRSALLKVLEQQREQGVIKHSLEAQLTIFIDEQSPYSKELTKFFEHLGRIGVSTHQFLKEFMIVSQIHIALDRTTLEETSLKGVYAKAGHAAGTKCPRCWQWEETNNEFGLDKRCQAVLKS